MKKALFFVAGTVILATAGVILFRRNREKVDALKDMATDKLAELKKKAQAFVGGEQAPKPGVTTEVTTSTPGVIILGSTPKPLGNGYFAIKRPDGALGIMKDEKVIVKPKKCFTRARMVQGVPVLRDAKKFEHMLTPEGVFKLDPGTLESHDGFIVGKNHGAKRLFVPGIGLTIKSHAYDVTPSGWVISLLRNKVTIWKQSNEKLAKGYDFKRVIVRASDSTIFVLKDGAWHKATIVDGIITPEEAKLSSKAVAALKTRRGWSDDDPVMILK